MHTVKGSAAQVGLHRLSAVAHRVEDLIGRLRDGALQPSAEIVDMLPRVRRRAEEISAPPVGERSRNGRGR